MSAQLTLTDAEMDALQKCVSEAQAVSIRDVEFWQPGEAEAALSAYRKFTPHLNRASRRRSKATA